RYHDLIEKGKHSTAISEMKQYLQEGVEEESDAQHLMQIARQFDEGVKQAILELEQGMPEDAIRHITKLKEDLKQIKVYADLVSKDEADLE
ncbi:hypothetical protein GOV07_03775, partial [Candidatus Woesearchaeota archaeon]|nr:hypothetical protein [Candidatus Woesearchaeota archaeon]